MIGDLHCHTRLSDGSMSIDDLIFYAKRAGLDFVAVTDHDTMDGVTRATVLGKRYGISVIPAVEISCFDNSRQKEVHMLCYLPEKPDRLQGMFNQALENRTRAGKRMIRALLRFYPVTEEHIARYTMGSKSIYKAHIMQALMDLGYGAKSHGALYEELLAPDKGICAREPEYVDVYDALDNIHSAGGLAVLAHPPMFGSMELLTELAKEQRIHGVEAWHPEISQEESAAIEQLAKEYGLLVTGGSDFHGYLCRNPQPLASRIVTEKDINALFARKRALLRGQGGAG